MHLGLPAAVEWYLRGFAKRHDIAAEVLHDHMDERLTPEIEASAYRIVQEALANAAHHSGAAQAQVSVTSRPERLTVVVADEGRGFDPAEIPESGIGLAGMLERSRLLGGQLSIESAPAAGTRVTVTVPTGLATVAG